MKLRIKGNTLRLRLTRGEVDRVSAGDDVVESITFAPGVRLTYAIGPRDDVLVPAATFDGARIAVVLPSMLARDWAESERVGITTLMPNGEGMFTILVEKDFTCLHRDVDEADAFPNPAAR